MIMPVPDVYASGPGVASSPAAEWRPKDSGGYPDVRHISECRGSRYARYFQVFRYHGFLNVPLKLKHEKRSSRSFLMRANSLEVDQTFNLGVARLHTQNCIITRVGRTHRGKLNGITIHKRWNSPGPGFWRVLGKNGEIKSCGKAPKKFSALGPWGGGWGKGTRTPEDLFAFLWKANTSGIFFQKSLTFPKTFWIWIKRGGKNLDTDKNICWTLFSLRNERNPDWEDNEPLRKYFDTFRKS